MCKKCFFSFFCILSDIFNCTHSEFGTWNMFKLPWCPLSSTAFTWKSSMQSRRIWPVFLRSIFWRLFFERLGSTRRSTMETWKILKVTLSTFKLRHISSNLSSIIFLWRNPRFCLSLFLFLSRNPFKKLTFLLKFISPFPRNFLKDNESFYHFQTYLHNFWK